MIKQLKLNFIKNIIHLQIKLSYLSNGDYHRYMSFIRRKIIYKGFEHIKFLGKCKSEGDFSN